VKAEAGPGARLGESHVAAGRIVDRFNRFVVNRYGTKVINTLNILEKDMSLDFFPLEKK